MAVVREMLDVLDVGEVILRNQDQRACFLERLSASGRGKSETVPDSEGQENLERSRRVVFKIRVKSLEERTLRETLNVPSTGSSPTSR